MVIIKQANFAILLVETKYFVYNMHTYFIFNFGYAGHSGDIQQNPGG